MNLLVKSFFGFVPQSVTDYIFIYSFCIIIIVLGMIILGHLKKKDRPSSPKEMEKNCKNLLELLQRIEEDIDNPKITSLKLSGEIMKIQVVLNKLVYSCTVIIEEKRDITFEGLRSSLQLAIQALDEANVVVAQKETQKELISKTIACILPVKKSLEEINQRYEKFGN